MTRFERKMPFARRAKLTEIRRKLEAIRTLQANQRMWSAGALFFERRGAVHAGGVSVHINEAAGELGGAR